MEIVKIRPRKFVVIVHNYTYFKCKIYTDLSFNQINPLMYVAYREMDIFCHKIDIQFFVYYDSVIV